MEDDPGSRRRRAIHFSDQVKACLNREFIGKIDWESDSPPSLKFLIKTSKNYEMRLEYNATNDTFLLYDIDAKAQRNEDLGNFSPINITTPNDTTPQKVCDAVKKYAV